MKSSNIGYVPQVDHLRAFAALWIVLYHSEVLLGTQLKYGTTAATAIEWYLIANPFHALLREGHSAVALFMVLSGFIFTHGAFGHRIDYRSFVINRILRIYPLYLCVLIFFLTIRPGASLSAILVTILPITDFEFAGVEKIVPMSWAVAVELQFYLLFPVLLAHLNAGAARTIVVVIATALALRLLALGLWANPRDVSYWHLIGRIDQFVLGMGAAVALRSFPNRIFPWLLALSGIAVIGAIYCFHRMGGWLAVENWKVVWPTVEGAVFAAFIVGYVGTRQFWPISVSWVLSKVGEMSFSIYLWHVPLIMSLANRPSLLPRWTGDHYVDGAIAGVVAVMPLVIGISIISYSAIERPFLRMRRKYLVT